MRGDTALLGKELREAVLQGAADENTSDDQLKIDMDKFDRIWPRLTVVARCQPLDKRLLVRRWRNQNKTALPHSGVRGGRRGGEHSTFVRRGARCAAARHGVLL